MTKDSHILALRFASKVALSTSMIVGCDHRAASDGTAPPPAAPVQTMTVNNTPSPAPSSTQPATSTGRSCETILDEAFNDRDFSQPPPKMSSEGAQCCEKLFKSKGSPPSKHFYDCCDTLTNRFVMGCTPWGPPVPASVAWKPADNRKMGKGIDLRERAKREVDLSSIKAPTDPTTRAAAIETWRGRMINEYTSANVFSQLADQIASVPELSEDKRMIAEVRSFADEERRHGVLCGAVVEAMGGEALARPDQTFTPDAFPLHDDATTPIEAVLRNVLSICCLSETVAVALIGAERLEMPRGPLRDLLTTIWSDEIGHARFGWRLVTKLSSSLDQNTKTRVAAYLEVAMKHLIDHELTHLPSTAEVHPNGESYGLCNGEDARALFFATLNEVILPRLNTLGLTCA